MVKQTQTGGHKLTPFTRKQTTSCSDLVLNLHEGTDDLEFVVAVLFAKQRSFSSLNDS